MRHYPARPRPLLIVLALLLCAPLMQAGSLATYQYPEVLVAPTTVYDGDTPYTTETKRSAHYAVTVSQNGTTRDSYVMHNPNVKTSGNLGRSPDNHWTNFSLEGAVTVTLTLLEGPIHSCELYPRKKVYTARIEGNQATFEIDSASGDLPLQLYARINEDEDHALLIFADPAETDIPDRQDLENVELIQTGDSIESVRAKLSSPKPYVVFEEGIHRWGGGQDESYQGYKLPYVSNKRIYLPGGTYVVGTFEGSGVDNVKLYGRGVLSACGLNRLAGPQSIPYSFVHQTGNATGQRLEGLVSTDPPHFHYTYRGQVHIDNVKMLGWWHQTDGIVNGDDSDVRNTFTKTNDDYIKIYAQRSHYENNTMFHQVNGAPFQFSWGNQSGNNNFIKDTYIVYSIFNTGENIRKNTAVINARNGSGKTIENNTWDGIYIDNGCHMLLGLNGSDKPGSLFRNFLIRNVELNRGSNRTPQNGGSYLRNAPANAFQNIRFENLLVDGIPVTAATNDPTEDGQGKLWFVEGGHLPAFSPKPTAPANPLPQPAKYGEDATPYPLYAVHFGIDLDVGPAEAEFLATHFDAYFGSIDISRSMIERARSIRPDFQAIRYVGNWNVGPKARAKVENGQRHAVLHYHLGDLAKGIGPRSKTLQLENQFGSLPELSKLPNDVVLWIRIGDEWMRLLHTQGTRLRVERGWDGSSATAHPAGSPVVAPASASSTLLRNDQISLRHDSAARLRWEEIAQTMIARHRENGAATWIDILIGNFASYTLGGERLDLDSQRQWHWGRGEPHGGKSISIETEKAIDWLQERFRQATGQWPVIWANNMEYPLSSDNDRLQMLLPSERLPRPLDGFAMENMYAHWGYGGGSGKNFIWVPEDEWIQHLQSLMLMGELKVNARPLMFDGGIDNLKFARLPASERERLILYGYASYLMGVKVEEDGSIYTKLGSCPIVVEGEKPSLHIYETLKWEIGRPTETRDSSHALSYRIPGTSVFARSFENGYVLVNPSDSKVSIDSARFSNSSLFNPATGQVTQSPLNLQPRTGIILLKSR